METKRIFIVLLLIWINIITSEAAECLNNKTAVFECCQDYKNVSGKCEACIGSWGKDCGNICSYGYYGHGCRTRCYCSYEQICHFKKGCVEGTKISDCYHNKTEAFEHCQHYRNVSAKNKAFNDSNVNPIDLPTVASLLAVSGLLILLLLGTVLYFNRRLKKKREPFQGCTVNTSEIQDGQEDMIYNDIRESRMVENGGATSSSVYNFPPQICDLASSMKKERVTNNQPNQARAPLTRSKTVGLEEYGRWYRGSDNYNHINFNSVKQLSSYSDVMTSDYDIFKSPTTSHEAQVNEDECGNKQLNKETFKNSHGSVIHQNRKSSSMVNRPYNSVKYNRNMRKNEGF